MGWLRDPWTVQNFSCLLVVWLTWYQQCDISEASFIFHPGLLHYVCTKHLICVCYGCRGNLDGRLPIKYTFLHLPGGKMWVVYLYDFLAHFSCQQKGKFDTQLKFDVITITKHQSSFSVFALLCSLLVGYFREYRLQNIAPAGLWDTDFKVTLFAVIPPRGQRAKQGWRCTKFRSTALHGWMGSLSTLALLEPAVVCWRTTTVLHMHSYHTESPSVCEDPSSHVHSKKITRSRMFTHTQKSARVRVLAWT